jgi:hypothetical protein
MPKALHDKLEKAANAQGLKGDRKDAFVYGTMRKTGWEPEQEQKRKSKATVRALRNR